MVGFARMNEILALATLVIWGGRHAKFRGTYAFGSFQFKKLGTILVPFFIYVYARSCVAKYAHIYKNASAFALA